MEKNCCDRPKSGERSGVLKGVLFGLIPHLFCILFLAFSVIGAASASALMKKFLVIPHFFLVLFIVSVLFAVTSVVLYLQRANQLCCAGIKKRWRYVSLLLTVTIVTNLVVVLVVFPAAANWAADSVIESSQQLSMVSLKVDIPCSGHASLIAEEIKKDAGVASVEFRLPDIFEITYDAGKISLEQIKSLEIFKIFRSTIL